MNNEDLDTKLNGMGLPAPEHLLHQQELKIPLLSYKRSSRMGLWLLILPAIVAATSILKYDLAVLSPFLDAIRRFFAVVQENPFLTYFIPLMFVGLPLFAMITNLLAFCHFTRSLETRELLITVKYRPLNIVVFLFSFAILVFFFLPDRLSF